MGWMENYAASVKGAYQWMTQLINSAITATNHSYVDPGDTEADNTTTTDYTTQVVCGTPLRETKCLFVPEVTDYYTDAELNTIYHSADEYRNAVTKYGLIYKSQKFENADSVNKLLDYALDWIKNNYHGGINNFSITALDMHLLGYPVQKFTVGRRVNVVYRDPAVQQETTQTLTVISAEYNLANPEQNQYKIGIPDVTLNKVYGETSKSGGGGGGGGKTSDQTDNETNTELDGLGDEMDGNKRSVDEVFWAMVHKGLKEGDDTFDVEGFLTPGQKDGTSDFWYGLTADKLSASNIVSTVMEIRDKITSKYMNVLGGVDTDRLSSNTSNTGRTNATSIDVVGKTTTKDLEVSRNVTVEEKLMGKEGEFNKMSIGGKTIGVDVASGKPQLIIDGTRYTLKTE